MFVGLFTSGRYSLWTPRESLLELELGITGGVRRKFVVGDLTDLLDVK